MASKKKTLIAIKQTLKDLLHQMDSIDGSMKVKMEKAIDSFIEESASQYTAHELNAKFRSGEKASDLLREYIEQKSKESKITIH